MTEYYNFLEKILENYIRNQKAVPKVLYSEHYGFIIEDTINYLDKKYGTADIDEIYIELMNIYIRDIRDIYHFFMDE